MKSKSKYQIVSIGDCAIDAFIRLHEASVHCDINKKNCQICFSFADKIPYETLEVIPAVGNSSNVAVGLARLGLKAAAFNAIGGDLFAKQVLEVYRKEKVGTDLVKINPKAQTNYHFVLNFQAERTILVKHNLYEYHDVSKIGETEWVYFSSMAENTLPFHQKLAAYLEKHPNIKMGFNPGTFQLKLGAQKLSNIYRNTHALFVNREEAQKILSEKSRDPKILFAGLHKLGPKIILITDGPDGSFVSDGANMYSMPIYPDPAPPFERTGAGDASSTGFMAALIYGLPVTEAAAWAPIESMSVVQYTGAQKGLLTKKQLLDLLKKAPKNYQPKRI